MGIPVGHPSPPLHSDIFTKSKVAEFLDPVSRNWDLTLISDFIPKADRVAILNIHAGPYTIPNKLIWPFERNGLYSVKSDYSWCYNNHHPLRHDRPTSFCTIDPRVWDWISRCKAPPQDTEFPLEGFP
ncbi:hypothetical protein ACFX2A_035168 [Malus domestica]